MESRHLACAVRAAVWVALTVILSATIAPHTGRAVETDPGSRPPPKQAVRLESVMVTARKTEESAQDVPVAMTAVTAELKLSTVRDLRDLNGYSANVRIDSNPERAGAASITIRGISPTRTDDTSLDSPIAVMIDGIYLGTLSGQVIDNFDIERIEILRGPQGTLYGRNTVGGVLNVVRTRPTGEYGAKLKYTYGRWNQQEFRAVINAPVVRDKLAAKAFFTIQERDGWYHNTYLNTTQPQRDYKNYGLTLLATPNDWFEALLTVERFEDRSQGGAYLTNWNFAPGVFPPPTDPREYDFSGGFLDCFLPGAFGLQNAPCRTQIPFPKKYNATDLPNPGRVITDAYTLNMSARLSDGLKLVSVTGYRKQHEYRKYDFDGSTADFITIERDNHFKQFSEELRLEGNWDTSLGKINAVAGGYYYNSKFDQRWVTGGEFWQFVSALSGYSLATNTWLNPTYAAKTGYATPAAACLAPRPNPDDPGFDPTDPLFQVFGQVRCDPAWGDQPYGPKDPNKLFESQRTKSEAAFVNVDWEFIPNWTVTAGVRWTKESKHFIGAQAYITPLDRAYIDNFPEFADLKKSWTNVSPKFGLSWKATPDILFYASYSKGWHSGGFFGVNQNVSDFRRDQYNPETSRSIEVGMKAQFLDNRLQTNIALFRNTFKNKQESVVAFDQTTNTVVTVFSNVGSVRYQGAEAEVQALVTENLNLFGTVGLLDPKYTQFMTDVNPQDGCCTIVDATFLTPRNAPKLTWGVGGTYTVPIGPGELQLGVKYSYVSKVEGDLVNLAAGRIPARENLNASISYSWDKYKVSVFGTNLTNDRFETPAIIQPLFAAGTVGPGRAWGIELSADF
ncbi:MAG: TonB-dependent receptor [Alphaproteobacteria bacterium]|nr:TonB-dependent receptor [Alphaproteobacteria bacterium]